MLLHPPPRTTPIAPYVGRARARPKHREAGQWVVRRVIVPGCTSLQRHRVIDARGAPGESASAGRARRPSSSHGTSGRRLMERDFSTPGMPVSTPGDTNTVLPDRTARARTLSNPASMAQPHPFGAIEEERKIAPRPVPSAQPRALSFWKPAGFKKKRGSHPALYPRAGYRAARPARTAPRGRGYPR